MDLHYDKIKQIIEESVKFKNQNIQFDADEIASSYVNEITSSFAPSCILVYDYSVNEIVYHSNELYDLSGIKDTLPLKTARLFNLLSADSRLHLIASMLGITLKIKQLIKNGIIDDYIITIQNKVITPDGQGKWLLNQFLKFYTENNTPIAIVIKVTDISHFNLNQKPSIYLYSKKENKIVHHFGFTNTTPQIITQREKEVFELIDKGFLEKEIADQLHISVSTTKKHKQNVFKKLNTTNSITALSALKKLSIL